MWRLVRQTEYPPTTRTGSSFSFSVAVIGRTEFSKAATHQTKLDYSRWVALERRKESAVSARFLAPECGNGGRMPTCVKGTHTQEPTKNNHMRDSMKNICGTPWCLTLLASLLLAACSPPEKDKVATAAQESAVPKLDLVRAPIPIELEPLKSAADRGDGKAADALASWYLNREYEFFDPQKAYELGFVVEKVKPALGLRIRAYAIRQGATAKADESVEALGKKVKELPSKGDSIIVGSTEWSARRLLSQNDRAKTRAKLLKQLSKGVRDTVAEFNANYTSVPDKKVQEAVVSVITTLRSESDSGNTEATGRLAYWLAITLPAFGFSEKDILAIGVTPKIIATDALTLAQKAADAGDARGTVALVRLSRNSESKLADLRAKVAKFDTPEQTRFIADLIENTGSEVGVLHDIFPEWSNKDVLALKRSWLRKAGAAGNLDSYGELAATYFVASQYCRYKFGVTETRREIVQALGCEDEFKADGAGIQNALKDGTRVGNRDALMMAAVILLDGNGVAQDFTTGLDYLQRSAGICQ